MYNQNNMVQSVLSSAVKTVMRSQGSLLGAGKLDVSSLLSGGLYLIDTWVELEVSANVVDDCRTFGSPVVTAGTWQMTKDNRCVDELARYTFMLIIPTM